MKVLDYINKKNADNTIYIVSKKSLATLSAEDESMEGMALSNNPNSSNGKKNKHNKKGKNNNPYTIYYGKVQYLLKNKRMMSWISDIDILEESTYPAETVKGKKEYLIEELELIEI